MEKIDFHIVEKAKEFVIRMLDAGLSENFVFHSKAHTLDVLKNVEIIGKYDGLQEAEINLLKISAIFHDVGYLKIYKGHEMQSAQIAKKFLNSLQINEVDINRVVTSILATKVPQNPKDALSEILCDADLLHCTYDNYFDYMELLRQEWKLCGIADFNKKEFYKNTIAFFNSHSFHSRYGREVLSRKKDAVLDRIKRRMDKF